MKKIPVTLAGVCTYAHTSDLANNIININKKIAIKPINV